MRSLTTPMKLSLPQPKAFGARACATRERPQEATQPPRALFSLLFSALSLLPLTPTESSADERAFTYSYQTDTLPEGALEVEQWITNKSGHREGDYSQWNFRTELEYGITSRLQTALYLNFNATRESASGEEDKDSFKFKGISSEWVYQLLNPHLDPVGLALYGEYTTDGLDHELEAKVLLSKSFGDFTAAFNAAYEAEWEREHARTERESTLEFTSGISYKITPQWAVGVEARNKSAYPDGLDLSRQEYQTWSVGPNLHFGSASWWATLTVLPQVWGNGEGSRGGRQLVHQEALEVRLIVGKVF